MTTALTQLWALAAVSTPDLHTTIMEAMAEVDAVVADRDHLAARVAELEQWGRDRQQEWQQVNDAMIDEREAALRRVAELEAASAKHWRALQPLTDMLGTGLEMFAWENLIAALRQRVEGDDLVRESAQREADLQTLVERAQEVTVDREAQGRAWAASCVTADGRWAREPEADADPCPVHFGTIRRSLQISGDTWGFDSKASAEAVIDGLEWMARQVAAMREGR